METMNIRMLFSWSLVALLALLSAFVPRELLPTEEVADFSSLESIAMFRYGSRDFGPNAGWDSEGDVVLFNLSTVRPCSTGVSWRLGDAGSQRADGRPLMRYESLSIPLGINGTEDVTVSVFDESDVVLAQGSFVHDFSAGPLVLALRDGAYGLPVMTPFDGQTP